MFVFAWNLGPAAGVRGLGEGEWGCGGEVITLDGGRKDRKG